MKHEPVPAEVSAWLAGEPMPVEERPFATFTRYCNDPAYRKQLDDETVMMRARANAAIDAGIARYRARMEREGGDHA